MHERPQISEGGPRRRGPNAVPDNTSKDRGYIMKSRRTVSENEHGDCERNLHGVHDIEVFSELASRGSYRILDGTGEIKVNKETTIAAVYFRRELH
jgi:hypothetical protein